MNHFKLNDLYNKAHVFILPSIEEGFATVILQAVAAGCPVIVSENTGAAEFVKNNKLGYTVPIRDSDSITDKLEALADNKYLLNEFSNNGIKCMIKNTWSDYIDQLDNLILECKKKKL